MQVPTFFKRQVLSNWAPGAKSVPSGTVTSATNWALSQPAGGGRRRHDGYRIHNPRGIGAAGIRKLQCERSGGDRQVEGLDGVCGSRGIDVAQHGRPIRFDNHVVMGKVIVSHGDGDRIGAVGQIDLEGAGGRTVHDKVPLQSI